MVTSGRLLPVAGLLFSAFVVLWLIDAPVGAHLPILAGLAVVAAAAAAVGTREVVRAVNALPKNEDGQGLAEAVSAWRQRTFFALGNANFRMLYFGNIMQFASMQMQLVVRGWLVFHLTGSYAALGTMALANALPSLIGSPIGGVVADRAT